MEIKILPPHNDEYYTGQPFIQYKKKGNSHVVKYFPTLEVFTCSCADFQHRRRKTNQMCKHIEIVNDIDNSWEEYRDSASNAMGMKEYFNEKMIEIIDNTGSTFSASNSSTFITPPKNVTITSSSTSLNKSLSVEETCKIVKELVGVSRTALSTVDNLVNKLEQVTIT